MRLIRQSVALSMIAALPLAGAMCAYRHRLLVWCAADLDPAPDVAVELAPDDADDVAPEPAVALASALAVALASEPNDTLVPDPEAALAPEPIVTVELASAAEVSPALAQAAISGAHRALKRFLALGRAPSRQPMIAQAPSWSALGPRAEFRRREQLLRSLDLCYGRGLWGVVQWQDIRFWS